MKKTIRWFEGKIGKHDTNLLIFVIIEFGLVTSAFLAYHSEIWLPLYSLSVVLLGWAFERVNKQFSKKGKK